MLILKKCLQYSFLVSFGLMICSESVFAESDVKKVAVENAVIDLSQKCREDLRVFPGPSNQNLLNKSCARVEKIEGCESNAGRQIYHYDKASSFPGAKKILVFSLIHGDETHAGSVGRYWMERLENIDPRNSWRLIPILNPDGVIAKTRTNGNKVDLNRNFPTRDWDDLALQYWKSKTKENPRRYPGDAGASEKETKCALKHISDYSPDFVVSIHTPLKVLDFDGPKGVAPRYSYLPWKSLGHFPGSLGRYLWFERSTPVLTLELKEDLPQTFEPFVQLHDVIGQLVKYEMPQKKSND